MSNALKNVFIENKENKEKDLSFKVFFKRFAVDLKQVFDSYRIESS